MPGVTAGYSTFVNYAEMSRLARLQGQSTPSHVCRSPGLLGCCLTGQCWTFGVLRWGYTTIYTASPKKKKRWRNSCFAVHAEPPRGLCLPKKKKNHTREKWWIFACYDGNAFGLHYSSWYSWVLHKTECWRRLPHCQAKDASIGSRWWTCNDLKIPIAPVLHLGSLVHVPSVCSGLLVRTISFERRSRLWKLLWIEVD